MIVQLLTSQTKSLVPFCHANTTVILLQSGVYSATKLLQEFPQLCIYALDNDWWASGLAINDKVKLVNAHQWVELCAIHYPVITIQ